MAAFKSNQQRKRSDEFRRLLVRISDRLDEREVEKIDFLYQVSVESGEVKEDGLDLLRELERRRIFSPANPEPLIQEINRFDIAEDVGRTVAQGPISRASSLPPMCTYQPGKLAKPVAQCIKITLSSPDDQEQRVLHTSPPLRSSGSIGSDYHHLRVPYEPHALNLEQHASLPISEAFTAEAPFSSAVDQLDCDSGISSPIRYRSPCSEDDDGTRHLFGRQSPLGTSLSVLDSMYQEPGSNETLQNLSYEEAVESNKSSKLLMMKIPTADEKEVGEQHRHTPQTCLGKTIFTYILCLSVWLHV